MTLLRSSAPPARALAVFPFLVALLVLGSGSAFGAVWVAEATLPAVDPVTVSVTIDDTAAQIEIALTGPDAKWFAVGFGSTSMMNTYAIITHSDGTAEERTLGNHTPGNSLAFPSITLASHVPHGDGTATFTMTRAQSPGLPGVYVFPMANVVAGTPISIILAVGQAASFAYHGGGNRGSSSLSFEAGGAVSAGGPDVVDQSWTRTKLMFRRVS